MFGMMGVFAEYERSMIQERVKAGLERAKAQGKRLGRPPVPSITAKKCQKLRSEDLSFRKIGAQVGLSHQTVQNICARD